MLLNIIAPEKTLFEAEAEMVTIPGTEGVFGVLPRHVPFISSLKAGTIIIDMADGKQQKIEVTDGFAEVTPERVTVLISSALPLGG
ncbi:MAG: ATP synthase F1 subunit epsilon [Pseudomonadota bacterium]|nr:ATP synthase F1 subunit epsilon [Pseudomonadota bacterium]MDE3036985.1 ATP synthase F1 subunit epsilon [Pseudomonadota bacterium]